MPNEGELDVDSFAGSVQAIANSRRSAKQSVAKYDVCLSIGGSVVENWSIPKGDVEADVGCGLRDRAAVVFVSSPGKPSTDASGKMGM